MDKAKVQADFAALSSIADLAKLLDVAETRLMYLAYAAPPSKKYCEFSIPKRSGGTRTITAPLGELKRVQRRMSDVLYCVYRPSSSAHGFSPGRSVKTNADVHRAQRFVLSLDIKDFFPSINFGRVRGLLMARPFAVPPKIATVMAQICCWNDRLPQGAPSSPVISNIICRGMDWELRGFAKKHGLHYSRYADDLSFSTSRKGFPRAVAQQLAPPYGVAAEVGEEIRRIIASAGFEINDAKTRLLSSAHSQIVTGLVVNEFPNVRRRYVRQIRAMLYAWSKHGKAAAEAEFLARYSIRHRRAGRPSPNFVRVLRGKLEFLRMVRGEDDPIFVKYAKRARTLDPSIFPAILSPIEKVADALWVIEAEGDATQGTGFLLKDVGLITCAHVLGKDPYAYRPSDPSKKVPLKLVARNDDIDLAVLVGPDSGFPTLERGDGTSLEVQDRVLLAGYPNFAPGHEAYMQWGQITAFRKVSGIRRFLISSTIASGASGSPVLNESFKVVGIAVTGVDSFQVAAASPKENHGAIPIAALDSIT